MDCRSASTPLRCTRVLHKYCAVALARALDACNPPPLITMALYFCFQFLLHTLFKLGEICLSQDDIIRWLDC